MAWNRAALYRKAVAYTDTDQPQKRRLVASLAPLAYEDANGVMQSIDMTPQRIQTQAFNGWRITNNGWHYGLETNGQVWFGGKRGQHFFKFRLSRIGYTQVDQGAKPDFAQDFTDIGGAPTYNTANLSFTPNAITLPDGDATVGALAEWRDLWPALPAGEIYARWSLNGDRLKEEIVITQAAREWIAANRAPGYYGLTPSQTWLTFAFQVDWSDVPKRYRNGVDLTQATDFNDADGAIEGRNALDELLFYMPLDEAYVDNGDLIKPRVRLVKRFWRNADGQWWLVVGAKVSDLAALPAGDLIFDPTITPAVSASGDDGYTIGNASSIDTTDVSLIAGYYNASGAGELEVFMRFSTTGLDQGDTIDDAFLSLVSQSNAFFVSTDLSIYAQDADDATAPTTYAAFQALALTTANTAWSPASWPGAGGGVTTPSFTGAIQEVVDRAGFAVGNDITIVVKNNGTTGNDIVLWAAENSAVYTAPTLTIEYTAGGGGTAQELSGVIAATATYAATLAATKPLTGAVAGTAAYAASLSATKPLVGAVAGTATYVAGLGVTKPLASTIAATITYSGALSTTKPLAGAVAATITQDGALSLTKPLSSTAAGTLDYAGDLSVTTDMALAGTISGAATYAASLSITKPLTGAVNATATYAAGLGVTKTLASTIAGTATYSGALSITKPLSSTAAGTLDYAGDLSVTTDMALAGTISGAATYAASLSITKPLTGAVNATATYAAGLGVTKTLASTIAATATYSGALSTTKPLAGAVAGATSYTATLSITKPLASTISGTITYAATLELAGQADLAGAIPGTLTYTGALAVTKPLAGAVAGSATLTGTLSITKPLAGTIPGTLAYAGDLSTSAGVQLSGAVGGTLTYAGALSVVKPLTGAIPGTITYTGALEVAEGANLSGAIAGTMGYAATLATTKPMTGTVAATITYLGVLEAPTIATVIVTLTNLGDIELALGQTGEIILEME